MRTEPIDADRGERVTRVRHRSWCVIAVLITAFASLHPFDWSVDPGSIARRVHEAWSAPTSLRILLHAIVFLPLGALLGALPAWRRSRTANLLIRAFGVALAFEALQMLVEGRHPRIQDLLVDGVALAAGARLVRTARVERLLVRARASARPIDRAALLVVIFAGLMLMSWPSPPGRPSDFDPDFRVAIGNETDGSRPWVGTIGPVEVFDGTSSRPVAAWTFDRRGAVPVDGLECAVPLLADQPLDALGDGWARIDGRPVRSERGAAACLVARIHRTRALRVRLAFAVDELDQRGPARIVTFSDGPHRRNFTVAQDGSDLVLRVRSSLAGPNGTDWYARFEDVIGVGVRRTYDIDYDQGVARLVVDEGAIVSVRSPREARIGFGPAAWAFAIVWCGSIGILGGLTNPGSPMLVALWSGGAMAGVGLVYFVMPIGEPAVDGSWQLMAFGAPAAALGASLTKRALLGRS